jgi:hypothetical protein
MRVLAITRNPVKNIARHSLRAVVIAGIASACLMVCADARADEEVGAAVKGNPPETPEAERGSQPTPSPVEAAAQAEQEEEKPPATSVSIGGDFYYGRSNLEGFKRLRDGFWAAGSGLAYPSALELRLATRKGAEAKIAFGIGNFYTADDSTFDQPHEAWYRTPTGGLNLTVGKFYVPFALQEWQYETKWGVMFEGERGASTWAASVNYNQNVNSTNVYARVGRNFGKKVNVGLSLAAGKGLSYDSIHNKAAGLDATASWKGWNLYAEGLTMRRHSSERFNFGWVKLEYDKMGKLKPFIAHWRWRDSTDNFGRFRSNAIGASYEILPQLAIEGGFAHTSEDNIKWIQLHWTPEWRLWSKGESNAKDRIGKEMTGPALASGMPRQLMPHLAP